MVFERGIWGGDFFIFSHTPAYNLQGQAKHAGILTEIQRKVNTKISSMLDSGCLMLEKRFTAENAENTEILLDRDYELIFFFW